LPENALARLGEANAFSSQNRVCSLALLLHWSASQGMPSRAYPITLSPENALARLGEANACG
jgi:hypothetical protein